MKKIALILFVVAVAGVLIADPIGMHWLIFFCKPLIMASLLVHYFLSVEPLERSGSLMLALIFSLAGDVFLISQEYFIPGLIAFLFAHLLYILAYRQHRHEESENALMGLQRVRLAFPIILAATGLVIILYPALEGLKIPVIIYASVLALMVIAALFRYGRTSPVSFWMVFGGAVLFMLSDSILAINKFLEPLPNAGFWIMATYSAAQYMIVKGLLLHPVKN